MKKYSKPTLSVVQIDTARSQLKSNSQEECTMHVHKAKTGDQIRVIRIWYCRDKDFKVPNYGIPPISKRYTKCYPVVFSDIKVATMYKEELYEEGDSKLQDMIVEKIDNHRVIVNDQVFELNSMTKEDELRRRGYDKLDYDELKAMDLDKKSEKWFEQWEKRNGVPKGKNNDRRTEKV